MYEIPQGETRWFIYRIDFAGTGTLEDDIQAACAELNRHFNRAGFSCSTPGFTYNADGMTGTLGSVRDNPTPVLVTGRGSIYLMFDITNNNGCGDRPFVNTAQLTLSNGTVLTARSAPTMIWTPDC